LPVNRTQTCDNTPVLSATYDSIARVLTLLAAGVDVRVASGHVGDITSPGTADLLDEVFAAKSATAHRLHTVHRARLRAHRDHDRAAVAAVADRHAAAVVRPE